MARKPSRTAGVIYHEQLHRNNHRGDRYAVKWWQTRGLNDSTLLHFNIGYVEKPRPGDEQYQGMFSIPYYDGYGREIKLRFRHPSPPRKGQRYFDRANAKPHLYNVEFSEQIDGKICLTEGEIDCMTLWQMGYSSVGVPGVDAWQPEWAWLFRNAREVVICADGDGDPGGIDDDGRFTSPTKGYAFIKSVEESLRPFSCAVTPLQMPSGMDVNKMYCNGLEDQLRKMLGTP